MKTQESSVLPPELAAELQEALDNAAKGIRDPEQMKAACEEMDRLREELRQRVGELNVAVDLIREARDET
jgi:succinate dehydrogenase/fumarate reductase flavoprotein subunit